MDSRTKPMKEYWAHVALLLCCFLLVSCRYGAPSVPTPVPSVSSVSTAIPTTAPTLTPVPLTETPLPTDTAEPTVGSISFPLDLSIEPITAELEGLPIDQFFELSFQHLLVRDPELLTMLGLAESMGLHNDRLNDLSESYAEETQQLRIAILELLRSYDREALSNSQQISYDVYEWYLDDLIQGYEFRDHHYYIRHYYSGYQDNLILLLTELHPFNTMEDAQDYIARLSQVSTQVEQLIQILKRQQSKGIVLPRFSLHLTRQQLVYLLQMSDEDPATIRRGSVSAYTVFNEKLSQIEGLSKEERQVLREAALTQVEQSYIPALLALIYYIDELIPVADDTAGVWKLPDGEAFYSYVLRHETSTSLSASEIHQIGLDEVDRIQGEMRSIFAELGYPQDASFEELITRAIQDAGYLAGGERVVLEYENLLAEVDERLYAVIDVRPRIDLVVVPEPGRGGYYVGGTLDGSRPAAFHAGVGDTEFSKFEMATIAYHEAIPGHYLQDALAMELPDLPRFRNVIFYNGYGEGWALYAEQLAWELGIYQDDPYGNLGRLYMELLRSVRLVADTGIHSLQWTREQAKAYMIETLGGSRWENEVDRYIVWPAQATEYKIGMLKILELRQKARTTLGDAYDPKEFHRVILLNGSVPLPILERIVDEYIQHTLNQ